MQGLFCLRLYGNKIKPSQMTWLFVLLRKRKLRFSDFAGLNTARAHGSASDDAVQINFNSLKIRQKATQCFSDDLRAGSALSSFHTAAFIFVARDGAFSANCTCFSHKSILNLICPQLFTRGGIGFKIDNNYTEFETFVKGKIPLCRVKIKSRQF